MSVWSDEEEGSPLVVPTDILTESEVGTTHGPDIYARVARLQALFAKEARRADRYDRLDEREIALHGWWSGLGYLGSRAELGRGTLGPPLPSHSYPCLRPR